MSTDKKPSVGEQIQAHVNLAIAQNKPHIDQAVALARKAGVGVLVRIRFTRDNIVVTAEPNVRVPLGEIRAPNFEKFDPSVFEEQHAPSTTIDGAPTDSGRPTQ